MKLLLFYRIVFITALTVALPFALTAAESGIDKPIKYKLAGFRLPMFQDSASAKKKPESKPREQPEKVSQDVQAERLREAQRRAIKQVPRSLPKLKPQPVTERVKIGSGQ